MTDPVTDPTSEVPWGRPPVPEIPVPPFASVDEHVRFLRCLAVHVAASGSVPVQRTDVILLTLLQDEVDALRWRREDAPPYPSALALRIALGTYLPAPWTPRTLVDALRAAGLDTWGRTEVDDRRVTWGSDPDFTAERQPDGSWQVIRHERSDRTRYADLADDDALVLLLIEQHHTFGYPLGHRTDDVPVARLVAAATPGVERWEQHVRLPYVVSWTETVQGVRRG